MNFVSLKDQVVATVQGHSIEFKAHVPTYVVPQCWNAVQEKGCVPTEDLPESAVKSDELEGKAREDAIIAAMRAMVLKNDRNSFTASGAPSAPAVSAAVGFNVNGKERDQMWVKAQVSDD